MKDNDWIAPLLWGSEFLSVLALCLRQGTLSLDDALIISEADQQFMQDREFDVFSAGVNIQVLFA